MSGYKTQVFEIRRAILPQIMMAYFPIGDNNY